MKKTDQFDWEITNGPSSDSFLSGNLRAIEKILLTYLTDLYLGPLYDHTLGNNYGSYAFTDTSQSRKINDTAVLISQSIAATGPSGLCLEFFYHM